MICARPRLAAVVSFALLVLAPCLAAPFARSAEVASPLAPTDALKAFELADPSLRIELVAAEPEVVDPVAIRFDEQGRMWVVEMRDYPLGNPAGGSPLSQIRILEDRNGDGRYESATTFADKLLFVTGVMPWQGGAFVTLSGAVVYMKDTTGDGRADLEETWFEGFAEQNSQLRANHPRLGLDNWIYIANGLRGGRVINRRLKDQAPINISGMDFRFDPFTGRAEAVSGNGQFGLTFDDWGNRFICSNRNPVRHVVLEDRYLKANPAVTVPAVVHDVAAWGEQSRIFPLSRAWTTSNLHAGQFTAACGVFMYRGDLLPAEYRGNVFTCDPTGNLIHREIVQPAGPTFSSRPAYEGKDFLRSPDEWFRPVNMELGPDGAMYVVDMYRCVIEHPDFVPEELKNRPDQRFGDDRGRIWRIVVARGPEPGAKGQEPAARGHKTRPALGQASSAELVALLEHSNAWQRETAHRLLLEREQRPVAAKLRELARGSRSPQARCHALQLLAGLGVLEESDLNAALADSDPHVRRQALLAAETVESSAATEQRIEALLRDEDAAVRFQARLTAMLSVDRSRPRSRPAVPDYGPLLKDVEDPWMNRSLLLVLDPEMARAIVQALIPIRLASQADAGLPKSGGLPARSSEKATRPNSQRVYSSAELALIEQLIELAAGAEGASGFVELGSAALRIFKDQPEVGLAVLKGMAKSWGRMRVSDEQRARMPADRLTAIAKDSQAAPANRTTAISLLAFAPEEAGTKTLASFAAPGNEQAIRLAAIAALARHRGTEHWPQLLEGFPSDTPPVRRAILDGLLANADRTKLLLDALEAGRIKASEIDLAQAKRLTAHREAAIRERAAKLFEAATPAERAQALANYQPVLKLAGDPRRGQAIFEKNCAACHRIAGIGVNVAPDISDSRTKKLDQLLTDIIQPNRAIDNNYLAYTVRLVDGMVATGILATETATSITLRQQGGKDAVIARSEIDELRSMGVSLMPEGLERQIPPQEMADLLAFIKNWRYLDGRTPVSSAK